MMQEITASSGNQLVQFEQIYSFLDVIKKDYTNKIESLERRGEQAVLAERAITNERIAKTEATAAQNLAKAQAEIEHLRNENHQLRLNQATTQGEVTIININKGLEDIGKARSDECSALAKRVALLSFTIGVTASGILLGAAATPFQPEAGIPVLSLCATGVVAQAPVLAKFDKEWRGMKNMPSANLQQKAKEEEMFPGVQVTPEQKKLAYDAIVAEEAIRIAATTERLRQAQQEADEHIANARSTAISIGNLATQLATPTNNNNTNTQT